MVKYICPKCNKEFIQKGDYIRHKNKKYPCVTQDEVDKQLIEVEKTLAIKEALEKVNLDPQGEDESLKKLDSFFWKIQNILRNSESKVGSDALDIISDLLFLRLLNYEEEQGNIKISTYDFKKSKIPVDDRIFELNDYRQYFKWSNLIKLVEEIDKTGNPVKKEKLHDLFTYVIFSGILKKHPLTRDLYQEKNTTLKKITTVIKLVKEFNKIDLSKFDVDIKGKAYESIIAREGSTSKTFGQNFTPRWIDRYMAKNIDVKIDKFGNYSPILDPACGTGGILTEYLSKVKEQCDDKDIIMSKKTENHIYGFEIVPFTLKLAQMNILLKTGAFDKNLKCEDFLERGILDFKEDSFDGNVITNPPFSLEKDYKDLNKEIFKGETKSGTMLFLRGCLHLLKDGKQCIMVSPNGKEIFSKNKQFVDLRKEVVDNNNVYKIAILPEGSFKPYTGVNTLILMIKKGGKTKEIEYVDIEKVSDFDVKEKPICKVKYEELKKNKYSWNYKDYYAQDNNTKYEGLEYKKLGDMCDFKNGKQLSKKNFIKGNYQVIGGGQNPIGYHNSYNREENTIICSSSGAYSGFISKYNLKIWASDCFSISPNKLLDKDYLFLFLKKNQREIYKLQSGSGQPHVYSKDISKMLIPVPPIEIQNLIVKELDQLYEQKDAYKKILDTLNITKKGKFELLLRDCKNVKEVKLGDVCEFKSGKFTTKTMSNSGDYNFYNASIKNPIGKHDKYCFDGDEYILFIKSGGSPSNKVSDSHGLGLPILVKGKSAGVSDVVQININKKSVVKFFYYYLLKLKSEIQKKAHYTTSLGHCDMKHFKNLVLSLPSIEDQEKIVKEMEQYEKQEEVSKKAIEDLDKLIKDRFDYHLKLCEEVSKKEKKEIKEDKEDIKEEIEIDSLEEALKEDENIKSENKSVKKSKKVSKIKKIRKEVKE